MSAQLVPSGWCCLWKVVEHLGGRGWLKEVCNWGWVELQPCSCMHPASCSTKCEVRSIHLPPIMLFPLWWTIFPKTCKSNQILKLLLKRHLVIATGEETSSPILTFLAQEQAGLLTSCQILSTQNTPA